MLHESTRTASLLLLLGLVTGCGESATPKVSAGSRTPTSLHAPAAPALNATHRDLLDLAFDAVSGMPTNPHAKNRARGQSEVVDTCFEIGQLELALHYAERIDNWRKPLAEATYAAALLDQGRTEGVESILERALASAEQAEGWRKDRIRSQVAAGLTKMGDDSRASSVADGLSGSELGPYQRAMASHVPAEDMDTLLAGIDRQIATGDFELHRHALQSLIVWIGRFPDDAESRREMEDRIVDSWSRLPAQMRIEFALELADLALVRSDESRARYWVEQADGLLHGPSWVPEHRIPLVCSVAAVRARYGDAGRAEADLKLMERLYHEQRENIANIYRADALVPLAVAWHRLGDGDRAQQVLWFAVEESQENPNSRPRVDDLILVCCAMVESDLAPNAQLLNRMREIAASMGAPW